MSYIRINRNWKSVFLVHSYQEYLAAVSEIEREEGSNIFEKNNDSTLWFRGQNSERWDLMPKIFRHNIRQVSDGYGTPIKPSPPSPFQFGQKLIIESAHDLVSNFKNKVMSQNLHKPLSNLFEWMYLGQHYGLDTPLLDWTEDKDMALFFALDGRDNGNFEEDECAAVYVMTPCKFNKYVTWDEYSEPVHITDENFDRFRSFIDYDCNEYYGGNRYVCLTCDKKLDDRIFRQNGNFLAQDNRMLPINLMDGLTREYFYKIYILPEAFDDIYVDLIMQGVTKENVYGGYNAKDKVSDDVNNDENMRYWKIIDEIADEYNKNQE